jgi:hypothetical protein
MSDDPGSQVRGQCIPGHGLSRLWPLDPLDLDKDV